MRPGPNVRHDRRTDRALDWLHYWFVIKAGDRVPVYGKRRADRNLAMLEQVFSRTHIDRRDYPWLYRLDLDDLDD